MCIVVTRTIASRVMIAELWTLYYQVTTSIYNLILGKLYCEHYGMMHIEGNGDYSCKLKFKKQSIMNRNPHQVQYLHIISVNNVLLLLFISNRHLNKSCFEHCPLIKPIPPLVFIDNSIH